ncbi:MAG: hypothetical protein H0U49_07980 [Parachlamydiaceae bacterium]|nr:hypothetical protein [Parachlamydiaceae bacterium]
MLPSINIPRSNDRTYREQIPSAVKVAIDKASQGEYGKAQKAIEQICYLDKGLQFAINMIFKQCKKNSFDLPNQREGLSKFLYRHALPLSTELCRSNMKKAEQSLAEENIMYYQDKEIIKHRNSHSWSNYECAYSILNFSQLKIENKMRDRNTFNTPLQLTKIRERVNIALMQLLKFTMQYFTAAKIDVNQSSIFLFYAKEELLLLKKSLKASTGYLPCTEVIETCCSYFCGKVISSFSRQDLSSISSQKIDELIKHIQTFVLDCCNIVLEAEQVKNSILQALMDNNRTESIELYTKELALAGFNYPYFVMVLTPSNKLAEENKKFYENQNIVIYRNSYYLNDDQRADFILNFPQIDIEKKMEELNTDETPVQLKKVRESVNIALMHLIDSMTQYINLSKIEVDQSSVYLSYAKDEIFKLKYLVKVSTKNNLCSEIVETLCSYFCGKVISSFANQDHRSNSNQKVDEIIKDIQTFVSECCNFAVNEDNIKNSILQAILYKINTASFQHTYNVMQRIGDGLLFREIVRFAESPLAEITLEKFEKNIHNFSEPLFIFGKKFYLSRGNIMKVIKSKILSNHLPGSIQQYIEDLVLTEQKRGTSQEENDQLIHFYKYLLT